MRSEKSKETGARRRTRDVTAEKRVEWRKSRPASTDRANMQHATTGCVAPCIIHPSFRAPTPPGRRRHVGALARNNRASPTGNCFRICGFRPSGRNSRGIRFLHACTRERSARPINLDEQQRCKITLNLFFLTQVGQTRV